MTNRLAQIAEAAERARIAELISSRSEEGEGSDSELEGRIGWYYGPAPQDHALYEAGPATSEQSEAYQEFLRGYTLEAEKYRRSIRMAVAAEINELVQGYGCLVADLPVTQITDAEALSIGLAKGVLRRIVKGWGKP